MPTPIITFYSYKGGTGRSMGLANVAWLLASNGHRVLAIDWDLEAPGLHRYFRPFLPDPELGDSPGVIDLLWEYATATLDPLGSDEPGWHERLADVSAYATSLLDYPFPGEGTIDFVPAGRQDQLYPSRVSTFDWNNFYERLGGGGFLEALKRSMRQDYDYVLIDSRTGLSDTAGICTVQLPDVLVNCFTLNTQAIDGAALVAASVHRQRPDSIRMFPVPMRVEEAEQERLDAGRDYARRRLGQFLFHVDEPERYWGAVEVPYKGFYAYEEILATIGDRPLLDNTVLAAMERVTGYLTDRRVTRLGTRLPEAQRRELITLFRHAFVTDADRAVVADLAPAVFIVFDDDRAGRFDAVRRLWFLLRQQGLNVTLDRPATRRDAGWREWRAGQLSRAALAIVVGAAAAPPGIAGLRVRLPGDPSAADIAVAVEALTIEGVMPLSLAASVLLGRAKTQDQEPDSVPPPAAVRRRRLWPWTGRLYARQYRQWVAAAHRYITTRGLATVGSYSPSLDDVFIDLSLAPRAPHAVSSGVLADQAPGPTERRSIWSFLEGPEPAVLAVLGPPGSGKSTLLHQVARQLAGAPRRDLPIVLAIRDFAAVVAEQPGVALPDVLRLTLRALPSAEPDGWWEEQLHRGRCVVLLDGLDEVGDHRGVARWVERQVAAYPGNDFVFTSRPHGYAAAPIDRAAVLQVRPFDHDQVRRFIANWYLATEVYGAGRTGPEVSARAAGAAQDLLSRLESSPALWDLTVSPLLLTMVANVHRYRGALPGSRADLYGEIVEVLLWRRNEAKGLTSALSGAAKERLLAQLAFAMMSMRRLDLSEAALRSELEPMLRRISAYVSPETFVQDVASSGLLVERERGLYSFAHLTFQEYLAARDIRDRRDDRVLAENVDDPWWRETVVLSVADGDADEVVAACLRSGTPHALALAFECAEASALSPSLRHELDGLLDRAFAADAEPEMRRTAAAVLLDRYARTARRLPGAGRLAPLVPGSLYRLFAPGTRDATEAGAAAVVTRAEALAFADWADGLLGGARLPEPDELAAAPDGSLGRPVWVDDGRGHGEPRLSGGGRGELGGIALVLT